MTLLLQNLHQKDPWQMMIPLVNPTNFKPQFAKPGVAVGTAIVPFPFAGIALPSLG